MLVYSTETLFQNNDFVKTELKKYSLFENYTSCSYINVNTISDDFIKRNFCPSTIIAKSFNPSYQMPKSQATFIFIEEFKEVEIILQQIQNYTIWSARGETHFVFCKQINSLNFLPNLFSTIWTNHILNFVVVFVQKKLEVFTYNPFKNEIVNLTVTPGYFPDKIKNLYGYKLRISFFENLPLIRKNDNKWIGKDYEVLKFITNMLNSTFEIIEPPENTHYYGAYNDITNDETDFCFVSHFRGPQTFKNAEFTYPYEANSLAILLPFEKESNNSVILLELIPVVISGFVIILVTIASLLRETNIKQIFLQRFLYIYSCLLGYPFPNLYTKHFSAKFQITTFIFASIVFRTLFQCFLIGNFMISSPNNQINSISELKTSHLKIYISKTLAARLPPDYTYNLQEHFIYEEYNKTRREEMIYKKLNTSGGYVMSWRAARKYEQMLKHEHKKIVFYVMKEVLIPSFNVYIFRQNSPYLDKINDYLLREKQYVIVRNKYQDPNFNYNSESFSTDNNKNTLTFKHFAHIFRFLFGGLFISCVVFVLEILLAKLYM